MLDQLTQSKPNPEPKPVPRPKVKPGSKSLEDILVHKGFLQPEQLATIKLDSVTTGKPVERLIKSGEYVTDEELSEALGEFYGLEYVTLRGKPIKIEILDLIPVALAERYKVVPFELKGDRLFLAMHDPMDLQTIEFVERKTGYKVTPFISSTKNIERVLDEQKSRAIAAEISAAMEEINQDTLKIEESQGVLDEATLRDAPVARIVGVVLETAVKTGASDVHLEPAEGQSRLRYRIDGVLEEKRFIPKEMHDAIVTRIKILAKMKIDERRVPQDGRFKVQVGDFTTDLRVSSLPTVFGEKIVIRLLQNEASVFAFKDLGLRGLSLRRFEEALLKPTGMILVTGPTGSGKTVTLASALHKLNTVRVNIITLEDPVEIRVPGVNQVQVNRDAGLTFATGLRSFLRQDPNIIMVGEIRDSETAELAVQAALTGHLVLSTLHTNSAAASLPRLLDMGVPSFLLSSTINVILAQRLVRRICEHCVEEYEAPAEVRESMHRVLEGVRNSKTVMSKDPSVAAILKKLDESGNKVMLKRGKGCDRCGDSGYKGRLGIFEVLHMVDEISHLVLEHGTSGQIHEVAVRDGMVTLLQDGYLRVLEGTTTLEEVMRVSK